MKIPAVSLVCPQPQSYNRLIYVYCLLFLTSVCHTSKSNAHSIETCHASEANLEGHTRASREGIPPLTTTHSTSAQANSANTLITFSLMDCKTATKAKFLTADQISEFTALLASIKNFRSYALTRTYYHTTCKEEETILQRLGQIEVALQEALWEYQWAEQRFKESGQQKWLPSEVRLVLRASG